jgi:hypothetical protein
VTVPSSEWLVLQGSEPHLVDHRVPAALASDFQKSFLACSASPICTSTSKANPSTL